MTETELARQLKPLGSQSDFDAGADALMDAWTEAGVGMESVEPVLRFMEEHPSLDLGSPGPLVHFVEKFYGRSYVELLAESLGRKPTSLTVWMLNRVVNGTRGKDERRRLTALMDQASRHPHADELARAQAHEFLERLSEM